MSVECDDRLQRERVAHWRRRARQWRRGWHVTPSRNLPSIERVGLVPYRIDRDDMGIHGLGIFTWVQRPVRESLGGISLQRLIAHRAWHLTLLSYLYRPLDCHEGHGAGLVFHTGTLSANGSPSWTFHEWEEGHVLAVPVPPERIRVEATYDVGALFGL